MSRLIDAEPLLEYLDNKRQKLAETRELAIEIGNRTFAHVVAEAGWQVLTMMAKIREAPTIEPEQRWIPCSERFPEDECDVLACRENGSIEKMHYNPILTTRYPKGFSITEGAFSWRQDNVAAWMPLPEPWKGEACLN